MINRRTVLTVAAVGSIALLLVESSALAGVSADRGIRVEVASDDKAYLGVETACDSNGDLDVRITNRISEGPLDVTLMINDTSKSITNLELGDAATRTFSANFSSADEQIAVDGTSPSVDIQLTRPVPDTC